MEVVTSDKRLATKRALLDAARDLVFERGHDRVGVQEITSRAQLATGTYYNYFDSKQDIFIAVAEDLRSQMAADFEPTRQAIKDPATRVALTLKYYFYQAIDNQDWQDFTRCVGLGEMSPQQDAQQSMEDITTGVKAGRFRVDDIAFTQELISGMVSHVNHAIRNKLVERNAIEYAIRSVLQMLGLPEMVSKALTQTPLPAIAATKRKRPTADAGINQAGINQEAGSEAGSSEEGSNIASITDYKQTSA